MSGYNKLDTEVHSEELFSVTEQEHDEVMHLIAEEGYHDWSEELEAKFEADAWRGSKNIAGVLIKKACEHPTCSHFKCERGLRIRGIEI